MLVVAAKHSDHRRRRPIYGGGVVGWRWAAACYWAGWLGSLAGWCARLRYLGNSISCFMSCAHKININVYQIDFVTKLLFHLNLQLNWPNRGTELHFLAAHSPRYYDVAIPHCPNGSVGPRTSRTVVG